MFNNNNNKNITKLNLQINITSHDILNLFYNLKYHIISYHIILPQSIYLHFINDKEIK